MWSDRLGVVGNPFRDLAPEALVEAVSTTFGVKHLDVSLLNTDTHDIHEFADILASGGVSAHTVSLAAKLGRVGIPRDRDRVRELLLTAIAHAAVLGASYVQFHTTVSDHIEPWTLIQRTVAELVPVIEAAGEAGVTLVLENNFDQRREDPLGINPSRRPELTLAFVEAAGVDHMKVAFDPCNAYMAGIEPYPYAYELLRDHIVNVHIKDARRFTPLLHGNREDAGALMTDALEGSFLPVPVGHGAVPWDALLRRFEADGYTGWLTLEPMPLNEPMEQWARATLDFLVGRLPGDTASGMDGVA